MPRYLLPLTLTALLAAPAGAEITLSGLAAMGLDLQAGRVSAVTRNRLSLTASTTTDSGLTFGATIRVIQGSRCGAVPGRPCALPGLARPAAPMLFLQIP